MISRLKSSIGEAFRRLHDFYLVKKYPPPKSWDVPLREGLVSAYPPPKRIDLKYNPLGFHYDDCIGYDDPDICWCEHRGVTSHYGGGVTPGWHREFCPNTGLPWIPHRKWYEQPKCDCQEQRDLGIYILTLKDGTVHGPPPSPKPCMNDCIVISGEEIHAILNANEEPDEQ